MVQSGIRMEADRPLTECGLHDGDVMELVPWEPSSAASTHDGSDAPPELSSPAHELHNSFKRAASGLRARAHLPAPAARWVNVGK